jgi:hypothetical protein
MAAGALTRGFFQSGGTIFAGENSFLANRVRTFGLAAAVSLLSVNSIAQAPKLPRIDPILLQDGVDAVNRAEQAIAAVIETSLEFHTAALHEPPAIERQIAAPIIPNQSAAGAEVAVERDLKAMASFRADAVVEQFQSDDIYHQYGDFEISHALLKDIVRAAKDADFPISYLFGMAEKESSFDPEIKAPRGTAVGLMQFIEQTWLRVVKENGARYGLQKEADEIQVTNNKRGQPVYAIQDRKEQERVLDLRTDPYLSALFAALDLKSTKARIEQSLGERFPDENLYLPHFLGEDRAEAALAAYDEEPNAPAHKLLKREANANPAMFYDRSRGRRHPVSMATFIKRSQDVILNRAGKYSDAEIVASKPISDFMTTASIPVPQSRPDVAKDRFVEQLNARIAQRKSSLPSELLLPAEMATETEQAMPQSVIVLASKL